MLFTDAAVWNALSIRERMAAPEDKLVSLICDVCANPPPRYSWTFEGGALPEGVTSDAHTLNIRVVKPHQFGRYECVVNNRVAGQHQSVMFPLDLVERGE